MLVLRFLRFAAVMCGVMGMSTEALFGCSESRSGWGPTESFPVGDGGGVPIASLSFLDDGTAIALWYQFGADGFVSGRLSVWANVLDHEVGWSDPSLFTGAGVLQRLSQPLSVPPSLVSRGTRAIGLWLQQPSVSSTPDDFRSTPSASEFR